MTPLLFLSLGAAIGLGLLAVVMHVTARAVGDAGPCEAGEGVRVVKGRGEFVDKLI